MTWQDIASILAILISAIVAFSTIFRNRGDAAESIAKAAQASVDRISKELVKVLDELDKEKEKSRKLEAKVDVMDRQLDISNRRTAALQVGVERLVYQIKSMGQTPVYNPETDLELK